MDIDLVMGSDHRGFKLKTILEKHLVPNNFRLVGMEINNNNIFQGAVFGANVYYMNKKYLDI